MLTGAPEHKGQAQSRTAVVYKFGMITVNYISLAVIGPFVPGTMAPYQSVAR
jgi:hypothetical protein